jgi:predicted RNA polymerase sigma factor
VQEALLAAARQWPDDGVPANPTGWLITVASRRLVDQLRSGPAPPANSSSYGGPAAARSWRRRPSQVALTLRRWADHHRADRPRVPGARGDDGAADQPGEAATPRDRRAVHRATGRGAPDRVGAAAQLLYPVFTEGYTSTTGTALLDISLRTRRSRLTRRLHDGLPNAAEPSGMLALMLLTDARRAARVRADGSLVPLAEQDRRLWDRTRMLEGIGRRAGAAERAGRSVPAAGGRSLRCMRRRRALRTPTGRRSSCSTGCSRTPRPGRSAR